MAKYSRISKLSKKEQNEILTEFCEALASLRKAQDVAYFLKDLLGEQEVEMLAKRLKIARLLLEDLNYESIQGELKVSPSTVARVNFWLNYSGGQGYRLAIKKSRGKTEKRKEAWENWMARRRHPYLLLDNLLKAADVALEERKARQLEQVFEDVRSKSKLMKEFNRLISEPFKEKAKEEKLRKLRESSFKKSKNN